MNKLTQINLVATLMLTSMVALPGISHSAPTKKAMNHTMQASMAPTTGVFKGPEVNAGTASIMKEMGKNVLRLSSDFMIPKAPAPHFQVVDKDGNTFLLRRLTIIGDKTHTDVILPKYIKNVAKVQIYCSFAEVVLGEASFKKPVSL
jgi:hypothetical protein